MKRRTCTKCAKNKKEKRFGIDNRAKSGFTSICKKCDKEKSMAYKRSKVGLVSRIYNNQKTASDRRGYEHPTYTLVELREWLLSQNKYHELHAAWVKSNYEYGLSPSVDRLDDYVSYALNNVQLMTWDENNTKGNVDQKSGKLNKRNRAVSQFSLDGTFIESFHSGREASRMTGVSKVSDCVSNPGRNKTAGGFIWRYTDA